MKPPNPRSQVVDLTLHVAELLGLRSDREIADFASVTPENVANWREGTVKEFKTQTLSALKTGMTARLCALQERLRLVNAGVERGFIPLEMEEGSGPDGLQRQFADRISYDYLGHRFLYFDSLGSLAWENLIKSGYEQSCWLTGVETCLHKWMAVSVADGAPEGPIVRALHLGRRAPPIGLDIVSFGPGEGSKEQILTQHLVELERQSQRSLPWVAVALIDVSIPLLVRAAKGVWGVLHGSSSSATQFVMPFCADFEEGRLGFRERLPTARSDISGLRLVLMLGNVFGNLRDEDAFVRERLQSITRAGDLVWLEVGLRLDKVEQDPLFRMTLTDQEESAAEVNRRLLLEGPYRRWLATLGRRPGELETRVRVRQDDDSCRIPGSYNFCHDLVIKEERRMCTMLYSRRYDLDALAAWFAERGFCLEGTQRVEDSAGSQRVGHLLLRKL